MVVGEDSVQLVCVIVWGGDDAMSCQKTLSEAEWMYSVSYCDCNSYIFVHWRCLKYLDINLDKYQRRLKIICPTNFLKSNQIWGF